MWSYKDDKVIEANSLTHSTQTDKSLEESIDKDDEQNETTSLLTPIQVASNQALLSVP